MEDENSRQFLINKKISQLTKLINHLEIINADREYDISILNNEFDDLFNKSLNNYRLSMQTAYDRCELININVDNLIKNEYINELQKLNFDYSNILAESKGKIAEINTNIEHISEKFLEAIYSINDNLDKFSQEIIAFGDQQIKNIHTQIEKSKESYFKRIDLVDLELNTKIKDLEQQSQTKFNELEQNYKNSTNQLKIDINQSNASRSNQSLNSLKTQLIQIKSTVDEIKEKFQFELYICNLRKSFKQEINELLMKLENDLLIAKKQKKLMIGTVSDTHRNEIFVKNNEIARIYDLELDKIRQESQNNEYKTEINLHYAKKLKELEKDLNEYDIKQSSSLLVNNNVDEIKQLNKEIEKLNELKNKKIEMINFERIEINKSFTTQKENEDLRHNKKIKEDQEFISKKSNELNTQFEKLKSELHFQLEKFDVSIMNLQNLLEKEKQKNSLNPTEINKAFDHDEKELKAIFLKLKNDSEKIIENTYKNHENKKEIMNQQIIEMNDKIEKLKKSIHQKSTQESSLIDQSSDDANSRCAEIQEQLIKQKSLIMQLHSDLISKLQINHKEELNNLYNQISIQKDENKNEIFENRRKEEEAPHILSKQLELFESTMINNTNNHKIKHENKISKLDIIIEDLKKKNSLLKDCCNPNKMRNEENLIIQKLENELFIVEQHVKDLTLDLANCKKKIVSQEGTYNTQFGTTPTVAVLRPKTGCGQINTKSSLRPNTTFAINRSKCLLKGNPSKPIVRF